MEGDALVSHVTNIGSLFLKAKDEHLEVVYMEAKAGKSLFLHPYECENALYLFYIIEGKINYIEKNLVLSGGDCITAKDLSKAEYFEIEEDTKLLMVTQKPFFEYQATFALKLTEQMSKIQEKDAYTETHCNQTGNLALRLGKHLGLVDEALNELLFASKIHDLGKINVPLEILNKPGLYTSAEFDIMKKHPLDGYEMVSDKVSEREALMICQHHEKCDGSGYPYGLKKDDLLLESRIIAVADAFDALTSNRPYRQAMSREEALQIIQRDSGTLWDEIVVDALAEILKF